MPTRNVNLTPEQDAFVDEVVERGEYQNASEAIRDAVRALQQRRKEDELKLKKLRALVGEGIRDSEAGDFDEIELDPFGEYLDGLTKTSARPKKQRPARRRSR